MDRAKVLGKILGRRPGQKTPAEMEARMGQSRIAVSFLTFCLILTAPSIAQTTAAAGGGAAGHSTGTIHLVGVRATLDKNLDAGKVKQGDAVMARPEVKIHVADGVDLETSSRLLGHVDTVQSSVSKSDSAITVTFDKAQLKNGRQISIKATVLWIGQPPDLLDPAIVSAPADRTTPGIGVGAGMTGTPPLQGYQGSEIAGSPKRHNHHPAAAPTAPTGVFSQTNAIPGVDFSSDIRKPESASFSAQGHNVYIPGGTVFAFALAVMPASTPNP